jgi:NAD(P)H-dependent FMN reductase
MAMRTLLIVWHSRTGTAEALARAAADGALASDAARAGDIALRMTDAASAMAQDLLDADGYLFACPENLASMSGMMKEMVDRLYYPLLGRIEGRPFALVIAAGTDGEGAVRQWQRIATGWRLKAVADPVIVRTGADTPEAILADKQVPDYALARARDLGTAMAEGIALGLF